MLPLTTLPAFQTKGLRSCRKFGVIHTSAKLDQHVLLELWVCNHAKNNHAISSKETELLVE